MNARIATMIAASALALGLSTTGADAHPAGPYKHGHGHAHGHARVVRVARPAYASRCAPLPMPVVVRPVYAPYPVVAAPVVRTYPVAPTPYGSVVIDARSGNVGGYVGVGGPSFSFGIAF